ncbi:hypothetical protein QN372_00160 [Undibacterium sp. RTI2.1]|uniref:hypothetical protein n=1 Tax=unclassified Undibacterium TaxID=2630295 RepID=UPI002AB41F34|nr:MULTISPECIES: hypothetical protein [unclassified Undibacterium]MDY7537554.1 hypothetical protein [Undibacterium sp. 5I1]MEB0029151.1 hypothetical protein [Undibacterium sp. RTI2.1]MEB0115459.1 hypothetical protein [Undibacterium sp. RTI2.2]MEB0231939.1 hypothetical protein [Undibacterium sp. 10I3]MEB0256290.1 hypothetical protein [Undibacterium sp. 5I1]
MKKLKVGDTVSLNDHGLRQIYLTPIGCDVLIDTNSSGEELCTVTGYHAWASLHNKDDHRVFVDVVYKGTTTPNARLLNEVKPAF